ncbi:protoglobin domain-containing protein [Nitrospiraceae bacterium AH_259_D15_M11_P09]|nr:protoglobin domain-containing protein [Nitrospiraceae bacterium AH_259_D15_M11_P09]
MEAWEIRKDFLLFTAEEETALKSLQGLMKRHVDELVEAFYRHLMSFAETRRLLSDEMIKTRLMDAQKRYLLSLVTGPYDATYQEGRLQIGKVHERIGLTPQWYLGAYALYLNLLRPLIFREFRSQPEQLQTILTALTKVVFLDIQLAIEAYIVKSSEKLEFANRQLATLTRELEKGLTEKKKDLQQTLEQLRQTERLAELGTLASGMAHEIGTPMNVILGRAEYLMRRTEDEQTQKGLQTIVTQVERITRIMNQLLTFARRRPSERRPMDLGQSIQDCLEVIRERIAKNHIQVKTEFEPSSRPIHADPDQMSQVLLNLFVNAIHAMPEGGTLGINLALDDSQVRLEVSDSGCGIPQEDLPKIFDPFFTTKEAGKGTGLGLTVVHGIMQEHGGSIEVRSELGHGTTFTLTLPVPHQ